MKLKTRMSRSVASLIAMSSLLGACGGADEAVVGSTSAGTTGPNTDQIAARRWVDRLPNGKAWPQATTTSTLSTESTDSTTTVPQDTTTTATPALTTTEPTATTTSTSFAPTTATTSTSTVVDPALTTPTATTTSTASSLGTVPAGVTYTAITDTMWSEIEAQRQAFGDPNDCRARVNAIPATGTTIYPSSGNAINSALSSSSVVILKGGTYSISSTINLSGKTLVGAPGEDVVIDGSSVNTVVAMMGSNAVLANVRILNAGDIAVDMYGGNNNLIYRVSAGRSGYDSRINRSGAGFAVWFGAHNNCLVSTEVYDSYNEDGAGCAVCANGGNADGYAMKFNGYNNTVIDAHSFRNGDDGIDYWEGGAGFVYFSSFFDNGKATGKTAGDGNGVKLGVGSVRHSLYKVNAYNNLANGFDINGNTVQPILVQSQAYGNGGADYRGVSP